ncbi:hypothetical protein M902_1363 [Bacteriovorax sp. BAL6_X]|uniref:hypothetical protein n=1 Tax=Bacteriovorax sp. BAL6_X TaxID=1201290 RepID=UPI00038600AA|nr:hypothetical protein [Bacteriovorax sp. BAL6_X]EPZ50578.1 hypothetical protein M902_1363 [Bacteriovorax sp. BAL6_X]
MKKTQLANKFIPLILFTFLVGINQMLSFRKPINPELFTTLNSDFIKVISFGNYRFISSYYWTKTLLDADVEHVKSGEKSWLYYRFKLIADLDRGFYENYLHGGIYLSIIKDDIIGAEIIFNRGLEVFPNDYRLMYNAAFNYHFQLRDYNNSLILYQKIQQSPYATNFIILPRLIKEAKDKKKTKESHIQLLMLQMNKTKDSKEREILRKKIEEIKKASNK